MSRHRGRRHAEHVVGDREGRQLLEYVHLGLAMDNLHSERGLQVGSIGLTKKSCQIADNLTTRQTNLLELTRTTWRRPVESVMWARDSIQSATSAWIALASMSRAPCLRMSVRASRQSANGTIQTSDVDWLTVAYSCASLAHLVWVRLHQGTPPLLSTPSTKFDNSSLDHRCGSSHSREFLGGCLFRQPMTITSENGSNETSPSDDAPSRERANRSTSNIVPRAILAHR